MVFLLDTSLKMNSLNDSFPIEGSSSPQDGEDRAEIEDLGGDVLCLFYLVTSGQGDHLLGTDEENIVQARYCVYHTKQHKVSTKFTIHRIFFSKSY